MGVLRNGEEWMGFHEGSRCLRDDAIWDSAMPSSMFVWDMILFITLNTSIAS
jgi:hypothetical protein